MLANKKIHNFYIYAKGCLGSLDEEQGKSPCMELTTDKIALYIEKRPHNGYKLFMDMFPGNNSVDPVYATLEPNESLKEVVEELIVLANNADKTYGEWSDKDTPTYD